MYAWRNDLKSKPNTDSGPPAAMAEMVKVVKIGFIFQSLVLAKDIDTEIHRLGLRLIAAT